MRNKGNLKTLELCQLVQEKNRTSVANMMLLKMEAKVCLFVCCF